MGWYYNIAENMYMSGMHDNHVEVYFKKKKVMLQTHLA
jgi:hypothetical protein